MTLQYKHGSLLACVIFFCCAAAQTSTSTAAPALQATSKLVVVDIVVLDRAHRPVKQLTAGDFTVRENGAVQAVRALDFHEGSLTSASSVQEAQSEVQPPGIFTNALTTTKADTLNVILLDNLNTQTSSQSYVRSQVQEYLGKRKNGRSRPLTAVFALRNSRLVMLQGFTSDSRLLKAAADAAGAGSASPLLNDATGAGGDGPLIKLNEQGNAMQLQLRERYTLAAINELAAYLGQFAVRKNLVWFAGSFPFSIIPDASLHGDQRPQLAG